MRTACPVHLKRCLRVLFILKDVTILLFWLPFSITIPHTALLPIQCYVLNSRILERILQEDDLVETRAAIRKAALRLCFVRTLVLVAQSQSAIDYMEDRRSKRESTDLRWQALKAGCGDVKM